MSKFAFLKNPNNMMLVMMGAFFGIVEGTRSLFPYDQTAQTFSGLLGFGGIFGVLGLGGLMQRDRAKNKPHDQMDWIDSHGEDGETHIFVEGVEFLGNVGKSSLFRIFHEKADIGPEYKGITQHLKIVPGAVASAEEGAVSQFWASKMGFHGRKACASYGTEIEFDHPASTRTRCYISPISNEHTDVIEPEIYLINSYGIDKDPYAEWRKVFEKLNDPDVIKQIDELVSSSKPIQLTSIPGLQVKVS